MLFTVTTWCNPGAGTGPGCRFTDVLGMLVCGPGLGAGFFPGPGWTVEGRGPGLGEVEADMCSFLRLERSGFVVSPVGNRISLSTLDSQPYFERF